MVWFSVNYIRFILFLGVSQLIHHGRESYRQDHQVFVLLDLCVRIIEERKKTDSSSFIWGGYADSYCRDDEENVAL